MIACYQDFVEHGGRVISAAKQPEILHVPLVATNDLLSESPNPIYGATIRDKSSWHTSLEWVLLSNI